MDTLPLSTAGEVLLPVRFESEDLLDYSCLSEAGEVTQKLTFVSGILLGVRLNVRDDVPELIEDFLVQVKGVTNFAVRVFCSHFCANHTHTFEKIKCEVISAS